MNQKIEKDKKSMLFILGGLFLGIGAGLFFFPVGVFGYTSPFAFAGCTVGGLGAGLLLAAFMAPKD